jgi:hypothetical protein
MQSIATTALLAKTVESLFAIPNISFLPGFSQKPDLPPVMKATLGSIFWLLAHAAKPGYAYQPAPELQTIVLILARQGLSRQRSLRKRRGAIPIALGLCAQPPLEHLGRCSAQPTAGRAMPCIEIHRH